MKFKSIAKTVFILSILTVIISSCNGDDTQIDQQSIPSKTSEYDDISYSKENELVGKNILIIADKIKEKKNSNPSITDIDLDKYALESYFKVIAYQMLIRPLI